MSKARLDLPEPESPVNTTSWSRGNSTLTFFRLCSRAPRTTICGSELAARCFADDERAADFFFAADFFDAVADFLEDDAAVVALLRGAITPDTIGANTCSGTTGGDPSDGSAPTATVTVVNGTVDATARRFPTGVTMVRALAAARWLTWLWMAAVVFVAATRNVDDPLPGDPSGSDTAFRQPTVAWLCVLAVLAVCIFATASLRSRPDRLISPRFALVEGALALGLSVVDGWVFDPGHVFETSQSLATQYPLIAMATLGLTFGPWIAATIGTLIGPAELWAAHLNEFGPWSLRHTFSIVARSIFFAAAGALFGWFGNLLRRVEGEIADRRAKDEVANVLHDTVLQTLALVETRAADSDPDLARAARDADRDLRRFLFGAASRERHTLESRIRAAVERSTAHSDIAVTVNVIDDGCRASEHRQEALANAIGEAVTNAIKHAQADRIVVFAETDDDGEVFASVRDDGVGFDIEATSTGHGLAGSIAGRMRDAGGRSEIVSTPGGGTEVRLWTA